MKNLIGLLLCFLVYAFFIWATIEKNKSDIAKYYKLSRPTLNKWIIYFPCHIPEKVWKEKRKLTLLEIELIKNQWGENVKMVLNKSEIADKASSCYKELSVFVKENLDELGLSLEAWESCNVFPPVVCECIIKKMTGKDKDVVSVVSIFDMVKSQKTA